MIGAKNSFRFRIFVLLFDNFTISDLLTVQLPIIFILYQMKSFHHPHPPSKKGLRLVNEKPVHRVDRSATSFKSQILTEKDKLTAFPDYQMKPLIFNQKPINPPRIQSSRNQKYPFALSSSYNHPQHQLNFQFQKPSEFMSISTMPTEKIVKGFEPIKVEPKEPNFQNVKIDQICMGVRVQQKSESFPESKKMEENMEKNVISQQRQSFGIKTIVEKEINVGEIERSLRVESQNLMQANKEINTQNERIKNEKQVVEEKLQFLNEKYESQSKEMTAIEKKLALADSDKKQTDQKILILQSKLKNEQLLRTAKNKQIQTLKQRILEYRENMATVNGEAQHWQKESELKDRQIDQISRMNKRLNEEKRVLLEDFKRLQNIRKFVRTAEKSEKDKAEEMKIHIDYEVKLFEQNKEYKQALIAHEHDLQLSKMQINHTNEEIQKYAKEVEKKVKKILKQKDMLERELEEAKEQTEKIRKQMFVGYQQIISQLKNQIISLKQKNMELNDHSDCRVEKLKIQRDCKILERKIQDLTSKNKDLEENYQKIKTEKTVATENSLENSIHYFDGQIGSIIRSYEERGLDLNDRIQEKQVIENELKSKLEQLQVENEELKGKIKFNAKKERSASENTRNQLQLLEFNMRNEMDSLTRKIESLEEVVKRKNREIAQKDKFMTTFLLSKVKENEQVSQIMSEISKYFES